MGEQPATSQIEERRHCKRGLMFRAVKRDRDGITIIGPWRDNETDAKCDEREAKP